MKLTTTDRGFQRIEHRALGTRDEKARVVQQSSAVGDYPDAMDRPGSSFLWIGADHHLNREEVKELRDALTHWLNTGKLG